MKHLALALLATVALALAPPALAQQPPVQTRTYDYEWLYFELQQGITNNDELDGQLFLEDVSSSVDARSRVEGQIFISNVEQTVGLFHCHNTTDNVDILQVGPFAQQASADVTPATGGLLCSTPQVFTFDCPYRGVPITRAVGHDSFSFSGTYKATGRRGPIVCEVQLNDMVFTVAAWITRVKETRRGTDVSPRPLWWHEAAQSLSPEVVVE